MNSHRVPGAYYYRIWFDVSNSRACISKTEDLRGIDRWVVYRGQPIQEWPADVTFFVTGEELEDYLFSALHGWILISAKAKQAIQNCVEIRDVQFLPVRVYDERLGETLGQHWLFHVVKTVDALDWERTTWLHPDRKYTDEHPALDIVQEALLAPALHGINAFHLKIRGDVRGPFISERLKSCLETSDAATGFKFVPVPAY